jgi:hypothetical protein
MTVTSAPAQMTSFRGSQFVHFGKKFAIDQSVTIEIFDSVFSDLHPHLVESPIVRLGR